MRDPNAREEAVLLQDFMGQLKPPETCIVTDSRSLVGDLALELAINLIA